jgi:4-amino-4-deoxy-L-arabinose transferase-like glycosyltransferase
MRWAVLGVAGAALAFFLLTSSGRVQTTDVDQSVSVAESIVTSGTVSIDGYPLTPGGGAVRGRDGAAYSAHAIGMPLTFVPIEAIEHWGLISNGDATLLEAWTDALFAAGALTIFFVFVWRLTERMVASSIAAAVLGLTTLVWPYAHMAFDAAPTACFLTASVYCVRRLQERWAPSIAVAGGTAAAAALLIRLDAAIMVTASTVWLVWMCVRRRPEPWTRVAIGWVGPLVAAVAVTGWYNAERFGSVFDDGHAGDPQTRAVTPIWEGVTGQLVSPGKGLVWFAPPILLAGIGWWLWRRRERAMLVVVIGASAIALILYARLANWSGDIAWGPRFLVPYVPLLMLGLGAVFAQWTSFGRVTRAGIVVVCLAGAAVQVSAVVVDHATIASAERSSLQEHTWETSQIALGWEAIGRIATGSDPYAALPATGPTGDIDLWWTGKRLDDHPVPTVAGVVLLIALLVGSLAVVVTPARSGSRSRLAAPAATNRT